MDFDLNNNSPDLNNNFFSDFINNSLLFNPLCNCNQNHSSNSSHLSHSSHSTL